MTTKSPKGTVHQGTVQGLVHVSGGWLAVVAAFTSKPGQAVISELVPITDLRGSHRRKAERWREYLS